MLTELLNPIISLIDKFIPDKDEQNRIAHEIATLAQKQAHEQVMGQLKINEAEGKHRSLFVAGWRPMVGWTCAVALAWHFIGSPFTIFVLSYAGIAVPELPEFDMASLMTVLGGMLGLGSLRTFEKYKGLTK